MKQLAIVALLSGAAALAFAEPSKGPIDKSGNNKITAGSGKVGSGSGSAPGSGSGAGSAKAGKGSGGGNGTGGGTGGGSGKGSGH